MGSPRRYVPIGCDICLISAYECRSTGVCHIQWERIGAENPSLKPLPYRCELGGVATEVAIHRGGDGPSHSPICVRGSFDPSSGVDPCVLDTERRQAQLCVVARRRKRDVLFVLLNRPP